MEERRRDERFELIRPARMEVIDLKGEGAHEMISVLTRDISSGGAFFSTLQPLSRGTRVKIALVLDLEKLERKSGEYAYVTVEGTVLRAESSGMAVRFDEDYTNRPPTKVRKRRVTWDASITPYVVAYRFYWCVGGKVDFDSDFSEVGNVTEVILPDDVPLFPLVSALVQVGVTAVDDMENESEMAKSSSVFRFAPPKAPSHLVIEDV